MASNGYKAVRGRRIRVTRLDGCGRPLYGEDSQAVSKGFITASYTANTTETDEINQQNAGGESCIYEPAVSSLTGYTLEIVFCEVDPELFSLVTGQEVYLDANGDAIGFSVGTDVDLEAQGFAFELWAGAPAGDTCSDPNATGQYGYFLAPFLKGGRLGDLSIENGAVSFTITGATTRDGNQWGSGPYNVMLDGDGDPSPLLTPLSSQKHLLMIWVGMAPPELFYGTRPVLDPDSTAVTALAAVEGGSPSEADFTFTGAAGDTPVWIDFGDGTWDYIEDGTDGASHTYAANGTYTARASSNGTWVTTTVTIPFP